MMPEYNEIFLPVLPELANGGLTAQDIRLISSKLWELLAGQAESFMMGGSSSIRTETAKELLKSACFVIRHGVKNASPEAFRAMLLGGNYQEMFKAGLQAIESSVQEGKDMLRTANRTAVKVGNIAYQDTLQALDDFFKRYHYHHVAHDIPCMIDYPLAQPVDEALLGIDYIGEFLRRLIIENEAVNCFETGTVAALLRRISPYYREDLLNIFEAVAANAIALTLLKGDALALDITERDRHKLALMADAWSDDTPLRRASEALYGTLNLKGAGSAAYLADTAALLYQRVKAHLPIHRLDLVFPSLYRETPEQKPEVRLIDNTPMDDEQLRAMIDELSSCRFLSDKIAIVRTRVHSMRDFVDILNIGFWGDEIITLFDALGPDALRVMTQAVSEKRDRQPDWRSETGWETKLVEYRRKQK